MNRYIHYIAGVAMLAFATYQLYKADFWEFALYLTAGTAFVLTGLVKNNAFPAHHRLLNILTWIFVGLAVFLFLFLVRTDTQVH